jgi:hypothetical protein
MIHNQAVSSELGIAHVSIDLRLPHGGKVGGSQPTDC